MTNPLPTLLRSLCVGLIALTLPAVAQVPNTLLHSIPAPPTGVQSGAQQGYSVAMDGAYAVIGAPFDDSGGTDRGVVKVFDSTNGTLLHVLTKPTSSASANFGRSVAISGSVLVVGSVGTGFGAATGSAYVYDLGSATPTVPTVQLNHPALFARQRFGWSVAISANRVVVGAYYDDTVGSDLGQVFVYDLSGTTPAEPVTTLTHPNSAKNDHFGKSVAISGSQVSVGVPSRDGGVAVDDSGGVYVFDVATATPTTPVFTLNNPTPSASEGFGSSLAMSGTRLMVGTPGDTFGMTRAAGSAYVYDLSGSTPAVPVVTLSNPSPTNADFFGSSIAISGTNVVVGAYLDDTDASDAGSAYVYDISSGTPTVPIATLNNPAPSPSDAFGMSVAISGTHVCVGASSDDTGASDAGSAYVYDLGSGTPTVPVATLNNPGPAAADYFGCCVAISGTRVVVGATGDDTGASAAGSAYVFDLSSGTPLVPVATLNNPSPGMEEFFSNSVAISGTRVVVGTHQDDTGATDAGSAYVYDLTNDTPTVPVLTLANPDPSESDSFGYSVAISGTLTVAGAYGDDTGAPYAGSAYVYNLTSGTPLVPMATLNNPSPATNDYFGWSVGISGTLVVVGAPNDTAGTSNTGSAYVYDLTSGTPTVPVATLNNPSPAVGDRFGHAVAISGTRVAVGAYRDSTGAFEAGSAYVYDLSSATPTVPIATLNNPEPAADDWFGWSVAISGTRVVVGTRYDDTGASDAGSAYVYDVSGVTPTVPVAILNNPGPAAYDEFGRSVAISDSTIVVGAPLDDTVMLDKGAAYIFGPHPLDQDSDGLLDSWETAQFGSTTGHSALDDSDHDGYCELLELALGLNPTLSSAGGLPSAINEGGYLTMTITKQAGVTYEVQSAGSLLPAQPDSFSASTTTVITNDATTLKVRDNVLIGTPPARFMRVKVTAAP